MDTSNNLISEHSIENLVAADEVTGVADLVALNPRCLIRGRDLIKMARTPQMVETLLLLTNNSDCRQTEQKAGARINKLEEINDVVDDETCSYRDKDGPTSSDLSMQVIKRTFQKVLEDWPSTISKIFDAQIRYKGLCKEDPELKVDVDFSIFRGELNPDHCCSVLKPDIFIHLSQLDVTEPESKRILLHPLLLSYLHIYSKSDWKMTLLKLLLLIIGLILLLTAHVSEKLGSVCWDIIGDATKNTPWVQSVIITLIIFTLLFLLHTVLEIPKVLFLHKNHWKEFLLQVIVFLCLPFCFVFSQKANGMFTAVFTFILLLNLLECLSSNIFCGKYILLSWGVLKTLFNSIFPILLLIFAMAATNFTLRQDEMTNAQFGAIVSNQTTEIKKACLTLSPLHGEMGRLELDCFFKSILQVLSIMYGYIDTSHLTVGYGKLREPNSEVVLSYSIHWLLTTTLATLILMNLLVGLTIGDVRTIDENADCLIVQIELKKLYRTIMRRNLRCCFFKCFGFVCRTKKPSNKVKTFYPNKSKKSCVIAGKKNACGLISPMISKHFILGCRRVRKTILEHYERRENK